MDARAPAVVAVLVTGDPGPWLEHSLAALGAQDYEELSVLVLVSGGEEDPTARVARVLPDAFVRRLPEDHGFGRAANEVLSMVQGAAFYLFCHDDCAPDPDAVHVMVEESYRSNAGVVTPKVVRWDDPSVLVHVGMSADKTGTVVERVQEGEVDHGQHDAVRDVFVAPGGCTLVRADLFEELGGFDPFIAAMGEDLDLSWRAQVAGARVLVVPDARVRHVEAVASGLRPPPPEDAADPVPPSLQVLQRRHELRAVLKCYGPWHRARVLPQAFLLALGEVVVALVVRDPDRARAVAGAWRYNLGRAHRAEIRRQRRALKAHRRFPDREVRRLQVRGSARLATYFSRLAHQGFDVAHGRIPAVTEYAAGDALASQEPVLTGSVGTAFSEDAEFDELDDLGHRSGRDRYGRRVRRPFLSTRPARLLAWLVAAAVLVVGTRDVFAGSLPLIGQFQPLQSWSSTWSHLVAGWQPPGVGTTAPAAMSFGVLGVVGTVFLGGMGLTQKILVLGCVPLGAFGVARLLRPLCSKRARLAASLTYLGLPLAYDALARGRWDGLVAFALLPFVVSRLAVATRLAPFGAADPVADDDAVARSSTPATAQDAGPPIADASLPDGAEAEDPGAGVRPAVRRWRKSTLGQVVALGVLEAVAIAFAPAVAPVVLLCGLGIALGSVVVGEADGAWRALWFAAAGTGVAVVLSAPWVVGTVLAGHSWLGVFGLPASSGAPGWGELLRFDVGPDATSPLVWLLLAAGLLPLLVARRARLAWAARLWVTACLSWLLALLVTHGWSGAFAPSPDVVLVPAALGVACGVGLGIAALETDLSGYRFGWRQLVGAAAVAAAALGVLPVVADAGSGHWGLPSIGYAQPLSFMSHAQQSGAFRVLWLGDPRAVPLGGWEVQDSLAYATSENGVPDAVNTWAPAGPGPAEDLARDVRLASSGATTHLGLLLVPAAIRYVVVVESLAPQVFGIQSAPVFPTPPRLLATLDVQDDLQQVPGGGQGFVVYENTAYVPARAQRTASGPGPPAVGRPTQANVSGWEPVLPGPAGGRSFSGPIGAGTVFASYAPAGNWHLSVGGRSPTGRPAFGWAAQYANPAPGTATLSFGGTPFVPLSVVVILLLWLVALGALVGRRWSLDWWWGPIQRRRHQPLHAARSNAVDADHPEPGPGEPDEGSPNGSATGTGDAGSGTTDGEAPAPESATRRGSQRGARR